MHKWTKTWAFVAIVALAAAAGCSDDSAAGANNGGGRPATDASTDGMQGADAGDVASDTQAAQDVATPHDSGHDVAPADSGVDVGADTRPQDAGVDAIADASIDVSPDVGIDVGTDASNPPKGCAGTGVVGTTVALDSNGPLGQLYSRAAFDGQGVWVTYVRPESSTDSTEDLYAVRVLCDGTVDVDPFRVNTSALGTQTRDFLPGIDARDGNVYIAWLESDSSGTNTIRFRSFKADGTPLMTDETDITPQDTNGDDASIPQIKGSPDVAALPGGGAVVATPYFNNSLSQIALQKVNDNGDRDGAYFDAYSSTEADQSAPSVSTESATKVWVSWSSQTGGFGGPAQVVFRSVDLANPTQTAPTPVGGNGNTYQTVTASAVPAAFAEPITPASPVFLAHMTDAYAMRVMSTGTANYSGVKMSASGLNLWVSAASGPNGGGALAWYHAAAGVLKDEVVVRPFTYTASGGVSAGTATTLPLYDSTNDYAHYPDAPSIVHLGAGVYFVTWSEGPANGGQSHVYGRFIQP